MSVKILWLDLTLTMPLPSILQLISNRTALLNRQTFLFRFEHNLSNDVANLANPFTCRSVRLKFEVRVQALELPRILAPAPVDVRQDKVSQGKTGLPQESLSSTSLCIIKAVQTKQGNTQEEMTKGWTPIQIQSLADDGLCSGVLPSSAKQHTK